MSKTTPNKLILVPYVPGYHVKQFLWLLAFSSVSMTAGFWLGYQDFQQEVGTLKVRIQSWAEHSKVLEEEASALSNQLTMLRQGRSIDKHARQNIDRTISNLEAQVANLKQEVTFYKRIMAPSTNATGLKIRKVEIKPVDEKNYNYKIVLAQVAAKNDYIQGVLAVNIIGRQNGEELIFPLREVSDQKDLGIKFRFRYFQNIEGDLALPEGFTPRKIQLVAQTNGKKPVKVEQTFIWNGKGAKVNVEQKT